MTFGTLTDFVPPVREAGGDNEIPRTKDKKPRIIVHCWLCDGTGKRLNPKTGNLNKCQGCGEKKADEATAGLPMGKRLKAYTRTTTYIDVLDDKSNLEAWQMRMVLAGVAGDQKLLEGVRDKHDRFLELESEFVNLAGDTTKEAVARREAIEHEKKELKDELNRKAQIAKQKAGAEAKADLGTHLHGLSELVDLGLPLPPGVSFRDVIDMHDYRQKTAGFNIVHMEKLVVCDELGVAGTPDRVSEWIGISGAEPLVAPDGHEFTKGELLITDLKTGTVEFGGLKMAMQLALYAHSKLYDPKTGERESLGNLSQKWGVIMNSAAGTGVTELYWADLELGWEAVQVAGLVRKMRSRQKNALTKFGSDDSVRYMSEAKEVSAGEENE